MSEVEKWQALSIDEVQKLFKGSQKDFWISGGWAIDLFLGKQTRPHDDLDISISRADQTYFQKILQGWDLRASDPPGSGILRPWLEREILEKPVYNIWARKASDSHWCLELMLCDFENDEWVYRRNKKIRGPIAEFSWVNSEGLKIISPEIQLLYKSRGSRDKDLMDLKNCLQLFSQTQKDRLKSLILADSGPTHPWIKLI